MEIEKAEVRVFVDPPVERPDGPDGDTDIDKRENILPPTPLKKRVWGPGQILFFFIKISFYGYFYELQMCFLFGYFLPPPLAPPSELRGGAS